MYADNHSKPTRSTPKINGLTFKADTSAPKIDGSVPKTVTRQFGPASLDRISIGIACCRFNEDRTEILLVCPRCTYAYRTFTRGKYNSNNTYEMISLFNNMTVDEKLDILSLNFIQIWYRMWLNTSFKNASYFVAKNKFESTFVIDGGVRLRKLIAKSTHANKIWEIPKGRKRGKGESNIDCAVREFGEETGISKHNYKLFPNAIRSYSYIDDATRYTNIYYFAYMKHNTDVHVDLTSQQISEISDIRWMDINAIRCNDHTGRLTTFVRPVFNFIKKHVKK